MSNDIRTDNPPLEIKTGTALSLSGGGYRAMLFHVGVLLRLNELGILSKLQRISSVSGGSITAAVLGSRWRQLVRNEHAQFTNLQDHLVNPILDLAGITIDRGSILGGMLLPGSISDRVIAHYREHLFGDATLQDLPPDSDGPRFVFNATSVQTGSLVRFSRPYAADYRVGMIRNPKISLAQVVGASSAFPPFLSPTEIDVDPDDFQSDGRGDLFQDPYTDTWVLTDGGVYDNLGLEPIWKRYQTTLVSDAGGKINPDPDPAANWAQHSKRILDIVDNQVRSLRKRQLIDSLTSGIRDGAYWGIRTNIDHFELDDALPAPMVQTQRLANIPTRLKRLAREKQNRLMNWGYAVCDAAIRKHASQLIQYASPPAQFPFAGGIGG